MEKARTTVVRDSVPGAKDFGMKWRVGGGIRTVSRARKIAEGASQVIVGTPLRKGKVKRWIPRRLARKVPRKTKSSSLSILPGENITIHGWRTRIALQAEKVMRQLEPFCAGFLCTDVDREGTMTGANLDGFAGCAAHTPHPIIGRAASKRDREVPH